jgi:SAM-dependent methyltransferase
MSRYLQAIARNDQDARRYRGMLAFLRSFRYLFEGEEVLDFGCAHATSLCALLELGARRVVGVEPDLSRVELGRKLIAMLGEESRAEILHVEDTRRLPFAGGSFRFVFANAVFEHIPQPRAAYIGELWRVVAVRGHLIVSETPNKYLPLDFHTTGFFGIPWLPKRLAHRYALWRGYDPNEDWDHSGWRGLGHYELVAPISNYTLFPELSRPRHRWFARLGLPTTLVDPYPTWLLRRDA